MLNKHHQYFNQLLGDRYSTNHQTMVQYGHDETEDKSVIAQGVLFPETVEEVSEILRYCNENNLILTASGARTGLSGGAIPHPDGWVLSFRMMNRIVHLDEDNHQITVEPGVITQELQEYVKARGLFYPPDPASKGSCFIGGNVAENSGGPKAVKYGVTKDFVLNLEIVLADGTVMWTGANVLKNATGYNLTQLVVGSEGTLAVITKIVLKLLPHPTHDLLMLVPFKHLTEACEAVGAIFQTGVIPSGLELMERDAIVYTQNFTQDFSLNVEADDEAHLLIECDGFNPDQLMLDMEKIVSAVEPYKIGEILFAESDAQKAKLWSLRRKVGEAVKAQSIYKEEDTVVPRSALPQLIGAVKEIGQRHGFQSVCYGHAGDGNLHVNILRNQLTDHQWNIELPSAIRELFQKVVQLGGTLSGEHGIGLVQKPYMDIAFQRETIDLMRAIKKVFDPNGILNPGKIFD